MNFLNDENDSDDNLLKINKLYADRYDKWRKGEELQKLKDKYGDVVEDESSTSEEEDEDAVELTDKVEKDFFKTLSCLKEKDPKIYDESVRFFEIGNKEDTSTKKVKKKPTEALTMAAYQRKMIIETNGVIEEEAQEFEDMPLVEQEKQIKDSFQDALKDSDSDSEGVGGLFKTRAKTKEELAKEEATYKNWLAGQEVAVAKDEKKDLKGLRDYWNDPKLDDGEKFLRDYVLNQKYKEKDSKIISVYDLSDSEDEMIEKQEEFERKFNFRFEEPDQDFIKRYPRTVEQSMRQKDDKRKKQRDVLKARKQAERAQKDEELKRLKALKRAEIMDKIKKLQEVTGNEELTFQENDVDGEFNPEEHDKRMSELFSQNFYEEQADEDKPEFPDLDEELEIEKWDEWQGEPQNEENLHCEDPGFVMDCDYDPKSANQQELMETMKRKKKRRQSKFSAALARPKPVFDPKNSTYEKYLDEYYALNYEDLIGDIPCRFKYRKVVPNDFGLSIEEILSAPDKELNRWASSKKIMRRRPEHVEVYEQKAYRKKAVNITKKMQILPSLYLTTPDEEEDTSLNNAQINLSDAAQLEKSKQNVSSNDSKVKNKSKLKIKEKVFVVEEATKNEIENKKKVATKKKKRKRKASKMEETPVNQGVHKKKKGNIGSVSESSTGRVKFEPRAEPSQTRRKFQQKGKLNGKMKNGKEKRRHQEDSNPLSSLSDARLKSYGLNPKKFKNKLKYGNK